MNWKPAAAFAVAMLTALFVANFCRAGGRCVSAVCAPVVHHQAAKVVVQKVIEPVHVAVPVPAYYAGLGVREDAVAELLAERMREEFQQLQATQTTTKTTTTFRSQQAAQPHPAPASASHWQEFQRFQQWKAQQAGDCPDGSCDVAASHPPAPPSQGEPPVFSFTHGYAMPATDASCASCHTGDSAKGGFDFATASFDELDRARERVRDGSMPPKGELPKGQRLAVDGELTLLMADLVQQSEQ